MNEFEIPGVLAGRTRSRRAARVVRRQRRQRNGRQLRVESLEDRTLLVDATETVVHGYVDYPPQTADVSYGLKSDLVTESFFTSPTPGGPAGEGAADVVISEIMYHPAGTDGVEDLQEEYIELFDPNGELVATGATDPLAHTAALSGTYSVRVLAEAGTAGEYILSVTGPTGSLPSFQVAAKKGSLPFFFVVITVYSGDSPSDLVSAYS
ncbi:MAG: hypothetical protein ACC645_18240 [Pirellulales bacterium]